MGHHLRHGALESLRRLFSPLLSRSERAHLLGRRTRGQVLFFASILTHEIFPLPRGAPFRHRNPRYHAVYFWRSRKYHQGAGVAESGIHRAIVGPLTSFLLAGFFWGVKVAFAGIVPPVGTVIFEYLAWINLALGVFNLLPGFPLDGGRVFRAFWWWRTGSLRNATRLASDIGKGLAVTLMVIGALEIFTGALVGGLWLIFIGMFLRGMTVSGYEELILKQSLEAVEAKDIMVRDVVAVPAGLPVNRVIRDYFLALRLSRVSHGER